MLCVYFAWIFLLYIWCWLWTTKTEKHIQDLQFTNQSLLRLHDSILMFVRTTALDDRVSVFLFISMLPHDRQIRYTGNTEQVYLTKLPLKVNLEFKGLSLHKLINKERKFVVKNAETLYVQ